MTIKSPEQPAWLDKTLFPFQSRFAEVEGQRIHYIDEGKGPTLLFLHANPLWSFTYRDLIKDLRADYRCVALDYPGFGLSGPSEWVHSIRGNSRLVESFVAQLGLKAVTLYAHDVSCSIGLGVVARRPELFRAVVVSNSFAWPIDKDAEVRRFVKVASSLPFGAMIWLFNMLVFYLTQNAYFVDGRKMSKAEKAAYFGPFKDRSARRVQQELFRSILNSREYLVELEAKLLTMNKLPALIVFGDDDATFRAGWHTRFERMFPNHRTLILKGGHHFPTEYDPQIIVKTLREWLPTT